LESTSNLAMHLSPGANDTLLLAPQAQAITKSSYTAIWRRANDHIEGTN